MTLRTLLAYLSSQPREPEPVSNIEFVTALEREAHDNFFTPAFRAELERALDICYGERPTTYTRKLRVIRGGKA